MENLDLNTTAPLFGAYRGKKVLVTGHTGFKGSWLALWLTLMGAEVAGYALDPNTTQDNFVLCGLGGKLADQRGDIRDRALLSKIFRQFNPEVVFHLAAQPIVRLSYEIPAETFDVNVTGTVNVLECIRECDSVRAAVIVTSDKCYENKEQLWGYRECDPLGGFDPYSASKGCAELVTAAYSRSFFSAQPPKPQVGICTARAGNVIGGGDWAQNRIVPDCIRALQSGEPIGVRNPRAVRPWQFVLEPLCGYLLLGAMLLREPEAYGGAWNFGPDFSAVVPVGEVVASLIRLWGSGSLRDISNPAAVHEAGLLNLDCTKAKSLLGWRPRLSLEETLSETVTWYRAYRTADVSAFCSEQIASYCAKCGL